MSKIKDIISIECFVGSIIYWVSHKQCKICYDNYILETISNKKHNTRHKLSVIQHLIVSGIFIYAFKGHFYIKDTSANPHIRIHPMGFRGINEYEQIMDINSDSLGQEAIVSHDGITFFKQTKIR